VRLRVALANSINTVAIKLLSDVGILAVREMAARAGIVSPLPETLDLSLALGTATVTPIELANAYATFASAGQSADTRLATAIGAEQIPAPALEQTIRPETAYVMVSIMRSVIEAGTARSAAAKLQRPAAGKTGTSDDVRDAWFGRLHARAARRCLGRLSTSAVCSAKARKARELHCHLDRLHDPGPGRQARDRFSPARWRGRRAHRIPAPAFCPRPAAKASKKSSLTAPHPPKSAAGPGEEANPDQMLLEGHGGP